MSSLIAKFAANSLRSQAKVKEFQGKNAGFERTVADMYENIDNEASRLHSTRPRPRYSSPHTPREPLFPNITFANVSLAMAWLFLGMCLSTLIVPFIPQESKVGMVILGASAMFFFLIITFILSVFNPARYNVKSKLHGFIKYIVGGALLWVFLVGLSWLFS